VLKAHGSSTQIEFNRDDNSIRVSKDEKASSVEADEQQTTSRNPFSTANRGDMNLTMLIEEHKKVEMAVKSFGQLLKSYKQALGGDEDTDSATRASSSRTAQGSVVSRPTSDVPNRVRDEKSETIYDTPQETSSESPPSIGELRRRTMRKV
jgi:Sec-independent protein translocase protein TatA